MTRRQGHEQTILRRGRLSLENHPAHLAADIDVPADDANFEASGFLVLINYLSGFNAEQRAVALQAPIQQSADDDWQLTEKAVRDAPSLHKSIRFDFPDGSVITQFPVPADPRIHLRTIASRRTASIWFAGPATPERIVEQTHQLQDFVVLNGHVVLTPAGRAPVQAARFGPFKALTRLSIAISDWTPARHMRPVSYSHRATGRMPTRKTSSL